MIATALIPVVKELNDYIIFLDPTQNPDEEIVKLGNIAFLDNPSDNAGSEDISNSIILSVVNLEEEKRLKNNQTYIKQNGETKYINPAINLNLYLLFSANFKIYTNALIRLSQVIAFFQGKKFFHQKNTPDFAGKDLEVHMEIHTLNFEQINDLWGSLGGKQVPFVMYKMRLIKIERQDIKYSAPVIEQIDGSETLT